MKILVTGATKGIGNVIAKNLEGEIYATGRNIEVLREFGNYFQADLTTESGLIALGDYIESNDIDVLINNAGAYIWSDVEKIQFKDIHSIIQT